MPRQRIFGSDELSALSPGVAALVREGVVEIDSVTAEGLAVVNGDGLVWGDGIATLEVLINPAMAAGCAGYAVGHPGTFDLSAGDMISLRKANNWQRTTAQLIGSDGGANV